MGVDFLAFVQNVIRGFKSLEYIIGGPKYIRVKVIIRHKFSGNGGSPLADMVIPFWKFIPSTNTYAAIG